MELIFDEEPIAFKRTQPKPAPLYEDEELPPPRRIAYPKPSRKSKRGQGMDPQLGVTVAGWFLALDALALLGLGIFRSISGPQSTALWLSVGAYLVVVYVSMLILSLWGWVWLIVVSFRETTTQGVLCLLVPCYLLYYYLTRWEDTRGSFCLHYSPLIGWAAIAVLTPFMLQGTKFDEALAENPQGAAQQAPNFNDAPGPFEGPPVPPGPSGPMPGPGGFPGGPTPRRGRNLFPGRPNIRVETIDERLRRLVEVYGDRAVSITVLGIPRNSVPEKGVTARDVSDAINKQLRELVPGATEFMSFGIGDRARILMAPVDDKPGLAQRINFGKAVVVKPGLIEITLSSDFIASVPRLPA